MAAKKIHGVIEAVHYSPEGRIEFVRAYERRGAVWSDCILLDRENLVDRMTRGQRFVTGKRKTYLGSSFEAGPEVRKAGDSLLTEGQPGQGDMLAGLPTF